MVFGTVLQSPPKDIIESNWIRHLFRSMLQARGLLFRSSSLELGPDREGLGLSSRNINESLSLL